MPAELTEESTHEDIQAAVDEIVEARKGEEEKGDAQKLAEERDKPTGDMTADSEEPETGSDDTAHKGDETGPDDRAWLDDDLKAEVSAYGIDETELADFTSRDELERALRFFDRSAMDAGRKAMAEGQEAQVDSKGRLHGEHGRFLPKEPEQEEATEGRYEINLADWWDDDAKAELVREFTRIRDHYESRISALEARDAEREIQAEEERFDGIVDNLGHTDLFGKSGKETPKELERRRDLFVAVKAQRIGLEQLGRDVDLSRAFVNRVARMVFAEELGRKDLKARTKQIQQQSNSRMGGGSGKTPEPPETPREFARRHYKELEERGSA